jgi:hypothetical protein
MIDVSPAYDKLNDSLKEISDCQSQKYQSSCMACDNYIDCPVRKKYVSDVYNSMSDGKGGFEF